VLPAGDHENAEEHRRDAYGFFDHLANADAIPVDGALDQRPFARRAVLKQTLNTALAAPIFPLEQLASSTG
jgi:hypothetical protein